VELDNKAAHYTDRAAVAEDNTAISSDDPEAIAKLEAKITALEEKREKIKAFNRAAKKNGTEPAAWYELPYIGADIKRAKERIEKLKRVDRMPAEIITFDGGEIESDPGTNRVVIRFDERQGATMTERLKTNGFHWSPSVCAWTRLRNPGALRAAKIICGAEEWTWSTQRSQQRWFCPWQLKN